MPTDPYSTYAAGPAGPAEHVFNITPSDIADLPFVTTGIYIGVGGSLAVIDRNSGVVANFSGLSAGTILPIRVARVMSTGTSAASLVGMA
jgi:hypothetical protein